jgi:putative membrane protein
MAAKSTIAALELAQLGAAKAVDDTVKDLARVLVNDCTAADRALKTIAARLKIIYPQSPDRKSIEAIRAVKKKTAEEFDAAFLTEMQRELETSAELGKAARKFAKHPDVKTFIEESLPVLERHAAQIRELRKNRAGSARAPGATL